MHIIEFPGVPLSTPIYGGFNHDAEVSIHAEPFVGSHNGFVIEFPSHEGLALHINPRMGCYGGENTIVLNSMKHGHWQHEERHHNSIYLNHHFHLKIKCHHSHFSIHVNGHHLAHFHHRESPHHIHQLVIRGDIRVQKIHFEHFLGHNGGGVQIGGGAAPVAVVAAPPPAVVVAPAPAVVIAPRPPPAVIIAPRPAPIVEVVVPPRRPLVEVVVPRRPLFGGPTVVIENNHRGGHHNHRRH